MLTLPRISNKLLILGFTPIPTLPLFKIVNTSLELFEALNILSYVFTCLILSALPFPLFSTFNCSVVYMSVYKIVFSP
jgi:hypothetical protein